MLPNVVVGGGIVGLAVAKALQELDPDRGTVLVEKEQKVAQHQTGHNSGVIHSGLYYTPGSLKARLVVQGARDLLVYCTEHEIPFDVVGKVVVATQRQDIVKLEGLLTRGQQALQFDDVLPLGCDHDLSHDVERDLVLGAVDQQVSGALHDQACLQRAGRVIQPGVDDPGVVTGLVLRHLLLLLNQDRAAVGVKLLQRLGNSQAHDPASDDDVRKHQKRSRRQPVYPIRDFGTS